MHSQVQYLDFKNGTGVRYLTQFDQGILPINNYELVYTYQGLTSDGKILCRRRPAGNPPRTARHRRRFSHKRLPRRCRTSPLTWRKPPIGWTSSPAAASPPTWPNWMR